MEKVNIRAIRIRYTSRLYSAQSYPVDLYPVNLIRYNTAMAIINNIRMIIDTDILIKTKVGKLTYITDMFNR